MGASFYAKTVVGVELNKSKMFKSVTIRNCSCKVDGTHNFCPQCGKPFMITTKESIFNNDEDDEEIGGFSFEGTTDNHRMFLGKRVSLRVGEGGDEAKKLDCDIEQTKVGLKAILEPLGLWDEAKFGIWCVGYCSY